MRAVDADRAVPAAAPAAPARERAAPAAALVASLRPRQWTKNALVFAAPGAAGVLFHGEVFARTAAAFGVFCAVASAGYLLNDLVDRRADREHPVRRLRPIAAGTVAPAAAASLAGLLLAAGAAGAALLGWPFLVAVAAYVVLVLAYSLGLKGVAVLDVAAVAGCYVIRAVAGSAATGVPVSQWFLTLVSFGALFVVAGKRAADLALAPAHPDSSRTPVERYPAGYLRYVWMLASAVAITAYCLWAFAQPHAADGVPWSELSTIPFVLAILRYALLLEWGRGGAPEDLLLGDPPLLVLSIGWLVVYGCGVYLGR
jgi:decaprenyl-phosphate phosphoribosyltransferase